MTVEAVVKAYIDRRSVERDLRPRTREQYEDLMDRYITPFLGSMDAGELTAEDVRTLIALIRDAGHYRTAELVFVLLKAAMPEALRTIKRPKHAQRQIEVWTDEQMRIYQAALWDHPHGVALALGIYMGLRRGEICGLHWGDMNLKTGRCFIHNQRIRLAGGRIVDGPPKSATSCRTIPIPRMLISWFQDRAGSDTEYVDSITPSGLYKAHRRLCADLGLPAIPLHGLRHCMATRCLRGGGDTRSLQCLLGHSTIAVTLSIYTHPDANMLAACVEAGLMLQ